MRAVEDKASSLKCYLEVIRVIEVRGAGEEELEFIAGCGRLINREISESVQRRIPWFTEKRQDGLVSLIGLLKGKRVGFPNMFPIEISPWGQVGRELFVITCLFVTGTLRIME